MSRRGVFTNNVDPFLVPTFLGQNKKNKIYDRQKFDYVFIDTRSLNLIKTLAMAMISTICKEIHLLY